MDKYAKLGSVKVDHWNVIPSVKSFKVYPKNALALHGSYVGTCTPV